MKSKYYVRYEYEIGELENIQEFESPHDLVHWLMPRVNYWSTQKDFEAFNVIYGNKEEGRMFYIRLDKNYASKIFKFGRVLTTWEVEEYFNLSKKVVKQEYFLNYTDKSYEVCA